MFAASSRAGTITETRGPAAPGGPAGSVVGELRAASPVTVHDEHKEQRVPGGDPPGHARRSASSAATTVAAVMVPTTLVMVRNMSGTRSSPSSSVRPASGNPAVANAGARLTMLADGTLATVSEVRNTAAPAWNVSPSPSAPP